VSEPRVEGLDASESLIEFGGGTEQSFVVIRRWEPVARKVPK
jgi:hypothetical protein